MNLSQNCAPATDNRILASDVKEAADGGWLATLDQWLAHRLAG